MVPVFLNVKIFCFDLYFSAVSGEPLGLKLLVRVKQKLEVVALCSERRDHFSLVFDHVQSR